MDGIILIDAAIITNESLFFNIWYFIRRTLHDLEIRIII